MSTLPITHKALWVRYMSFMHESQISRFCLSEQISTFCCYADRWITTNFCTWNNTGGVNGGLMFEKYDATVVGKPGGGGEYEVQAGMHA